MKKGDTDDLENHVVVGSQALARPDGRVAIALHFQSWPPIAIEMNRQTIAALKRDLEALEAILARPTGSA